MKMWRTVESLGHPLGSEVLGMRFLAHLGFGIHEQSLLRGRIKRETFLWEQ